MAIYSRQDLADYALRKLGAPVINIEVADAQLSDAIDDTIRMFQEYHPDGITRDYVKHQFTATKITVDSVTGISVGIQLSTSGGSASVLSISGNDVYVAKTTGNLFLVNDILEFTGGTCTVTAIVYGDADNKYIPIGNDIVGIERVLPWQPSYGDGLFDITYQLRMNDLRNLAGGNMSYFTMSMEYISMLDFFLRKEKQFRFNRRMGNLYLDIDWNAEVVPGQYVVIEVYRIVDDETYTDLYNDIWIKKYATEKVKLQWGNNLRKYKDLALPGGAYLNGENIMIEATEALKELEADMINNQAPLQMMLG